MTTDDSKAGKRLRADADLMSLIGRDSWVGPAMTTDDSKAAPEGPYCNDDGDWWVPVEGIPFKKARELVVGCLDYSIPDDGRLAYIGKEMAWLDDEHEGTCDGNECQSNRHVLAWRFEDRRDD